MNEPFCQKCGGTKAWLEELDKLLAMRDVLKRLVSGYTVGDIGHLRNEGRGKAACEITVGDVLDIVDILNSTPADIARKYVKREVLEKCVVELTNGREAMRQLVELANTNKGTKEILRALGNRWNDTVTLARKELEK